MKNKILIGVLAVFVCGVLALTIPKKASASTLVNDSMLNDYGREKDYSISNILAMENNTFLNCSILPDGREYENLYREIDIEIDKIVWSYWYFDGKYYISNFGVYYYVQYIHEDGNEDFTDLQYVGATKIEDGGTDFIPTYLTKENYMSHNAYDTSIRFEMYFQYYFNDDYELVFQAVLDVYCGEDDDYSKNFVNETKLFTAYYDELQEISYPEFISFQFSPNLLYANYLYRYNMIPPSNATYIDENTDFFEYLKTSTSGFLDTDIIGDLSLGDILLFVVSIGLLIFILRFFAGG